MTFQDTRAVCVTKNFFRICSGKRVTGDFFAAFNAFQKKRMSRALRDSKIGADRRKKVSRENIVNRNEVALFSEALKLGEGRLNHSDPGPLRCDSLHENGARGLRVSATELSAHRAMLPKRPAAWRIPVDASSPRFPIEQSLAPETYRGQKRWRFPFYGQALAVSFQMADKSG